jgi:hypothetical protein
MVSELHEAACRAIESAKASGSVRVIHGRAYPDPNWKPTALWIDIAEAKKELWRTNFRVLNQERRRVG